ncbi:MAG: polymer-forming cytoskeletal protein [Acidobacteria bacterium]|nr:polymer-forming cytoskeletal protein [Acidobacteriota bacterium]
MGIRESFSQAVRELTGSDKKEDKKNLPMDELEKVVEELKKAVEDDGVQPAREIVLNVESAPDVTPASEASVDTPDGTDEDEDTDGGDFSGDIAPPPAPLTDFRQIIGTDNSGEITIVSKNTIVYGNIRSFANMSIEGDVKGDIETTKNIDMNGKIVGNVTCNNALMHMSQVKGNIRMKGNVSMKRDALLIGDIVSTYADVNGKVKGNLDIAGKVELRGEAVVFGDINASTITVEDGAIIQGYVNTTFLNKEESRNWFPETIVIGTGI